MNVRQAQYLIAVCEEGSVSGAARRLRVSQPALSQTIQAAEREIGMKIFNRSANLPFLTYAGEKYLAAARRLLALEVNLEREMMELQNSPEGKLRIGISTLRAMFLLPKILPRFMEEFPGVELELLESGTSDLDESVLEGKVDLAFLLSAEPTYPDLVYITLCRERMLLIAGAETELAKTREPYTGVQIQEARNERFISLRRGHGVRTLQDRMFYENRIAPKILFETGSPEAARRLALVCGAVTLFPETLLNTASFDAVAPGVWFPVLGSHYLRDFFLCFHRGSYLSRYMQRFISLTRDVFLDLPTGPVVPSGGEPQIIP